MADVPETVGAGKNISDSLFEIERILVAVKRTTSLTSLTYGQLETLSEELGRLEKALSIVFTLDVPLDRIDEQLQILRDSKRTFTVVTEMSKQVELALSYLLDILDKKIDDTDQDLSSLFDLIENCTQTAVRLKPWMQSKKVILDASLEFNEILVDHIETLESVIGRNIELCFEIQEERFSSPVRHTPSFTLKQLVSLLTSNGENTEVKVPIFSNTEDVLCRKFLALRRSVPPIEKSLKEILPARITEFTNRQVTNIEYLSSMLEVKSKGLSTKYRFMNNEVRELKTELIDKRWTTLFRNLNNELSSLLEDVRVLQQKIANEEYSYSRDINRRFTEQLQKKSKTITKTFNVIYRALEFSLLDADVASETNTLAQKWLDIRPAGDKLLSNIRSDESEIQSLTQQLKDLKMVNVTPPAESVVPQRTNFGAVLMKKMNIKPVIIKGTPQSAVKPSPFYDKSPTKERNIPSEGLILKTAPLLPYSSERSSSEDIFETLDGSSGRTSRSVELLESEKIQHYANQESRIPILSNTTLALAATRTSNPILTENWSPRQTKSQIVPQPTPRAVLLSSGMM